MLTVSGYLADYDMEVVDNKNAVSVNSCGHYQLIKREKFSTLRPAGRKDYQLIYVARGALHYKAGGKEHLIPEGTALLYRPDEPQDYTYFLADRPEAYWIHFSGADVPKMLESCGFPAGQTSFVGVKNEYNALFDHIIRELQIKRKNFFELCSAYLTQLLLLMSRRILEAESPGCLCNEQVEQAVQAFHNSFNSEISIRQYAERLNVSTCWFIRSFRERMGMTPQKYITGIRINKAKELLLSSTCNVSEIAQTVGYQNPLYFSRIFKKCTGCSPTDYKRKNGRI